MSPSIKPEKIYLSLKGEGNQIIVKNDSIACYYLNCNKFSTRYQQNATIQIYGKTKSSPFLSSGNEEPISLMFLKRDHSLYFLLLSANNPKDKFDPDLLHKLIR